MGGKNSDSKLKLLSFVLVIYDSSSSGTSLCSKSGSFEETESPPTWRNSSLPLFCLKGSHSTIENLNTDFGPWMDSPSLRLILHFHSFSNSFTEEFLASNSSVYLFIVTVPHEIWSRLRLWALELFLPLFNPTKWDWDEQDVGRF